MTFLKFDRKKLAKDTLSAISQSGDGKKFVGHDGREYAIVSRNEKLESETFIDVAVKDRRCGQSRRQIRHRPDQDFPTVSRRAGGTKGLPPGRAKDGAMELMQERILDEKNRPAGAEMPASKTDDDAARDCGLFARDSFDDSSAAEAQSDSGVSHWQALAFQRRRDRQLVLVARVNQRPQGGCLGGG